MTEAKNKLLKLIDENVLNKDLVIMACLKYMSDSDVANMACWNGFFGLEEEAEYEDE